MQVAFSDLGMAPHVFWKFTLIEWLLLLKRKFPTPEQTIEQSVGLTKKQLNKSLEDNGRKLKLDPETLEITVLE